MGRISSASVALNIITCLLCGVNLKIFCTSRRISETRTWVTATEVLFKWTYREFRASCRTRREWSAWSDSDPTHLQWLIATHGQECRWQCAALLLWAAFGGQWWACHHRTRQFWSRACISWSDRIRGRSGTPTRECDTGPNSVPCPCSCLAWQ